MVARETQRQGLGQGWVPRDYLKEQTPVPKQTPPAHPAPALRPPNTGRSTKDKPAANEPTIIPSGIQVLSAPKPPVANIYDL
jgi:hypothetical protein